MHHEKCWTGWSTSWNQDCREKYQSRYADNITLMAESEEELKSLMLKVKESEKAGVKLNIQKTKIMASSPITSWQTDGETMDTVIDFIFLGSKITADGDCSHEIKRHLLLGRKVMTNLDSIMKSRGVTLPTKVILVRAVFSNSHVWIWELYYKESWAPKNWCFWTVVLEKTLASPLDCKEIQPVHPKGNRSWIFIGRTDAEAETLILLPPDARNWPIRKILMLGKTEGRRRRGQQRMSWWMASLTQWTWVWVNSGSWWWTGRPGMLQSMGWQKDMTEWLNWVEQGQNCNPQNISSPTTCFWMANGLTMVFAFLNG